MGETDAFRERYAAEFAYTAHLTSAAVIRAFSRVPRERYLGPGPWRIFQPYARFYWTTADADPQHLYHDVLVAIDEKRLLNNGHLLADVFYTFPAHPISPILPEAHAQNAAVIAAVSRAAAAFASRGYDVFLDGVVGPWFLPVVAAELGSTDVPIAYVVLRVTVEQAICRATERSQPAPESVVRQMHAAFEKLGEYASHVLDTTHLSIDESVAEFTRRRALGVFALDLARVGARSPFIAAP